MSAPEEPRTGDTSPEHSRSGQDVAEMTEGQVVLGDGESGRHHATADPAEGTSGGAQSVTGAHPISQDRSRVGQHAVSDRTR
jgi:hypothetical protein